MPKRLSIFLFTLLIISVLLNSCLVMENSFNSVAPGIWRATLELEPKESVSNKKGEPLPELLDYQFEEVTGGELPFNFEIKYKDDKTVFLEIINGEERIVVDDVKIFHDKTNGKDSIIINFPIYESVIKAAFEERIMAGIWQVNNRGSYYAIPFIARFGQAHRFTTLKKKPIMNVSGQWSTTFGVESDDPYTAIGDFKQDGNKLSGTFLTETGDYRFLDGTIQQNKVYLSCFDGSHAFLFEGKIKEDSTIIGSFRSGKHYKTIWEAKKNDAASLASPYELTFLKEGYESLDFSFENPKGEMVSINDEAYKGKVKLVQILGTWCPNCRDETSFLANYMKNNKNKDLAVIALAFEKYREKEKGNAAINRYIKKFDLPYEMLYAGYYNKKEAAEALPMLNHILSYPTLIFVDKNNKVRKIHTGFSGPATKYYDEFVKEFDETLQSLLDEDA